jgi:hypothetical protein
VVHLHNPETLAAAMSLARQVELMKMDRQQPTLTCPAERGLLPPPSHDRPWLRRLLSWHYPRRRSAPIVATATRRASPRLNRPNAAASVYALTVMRNIVVAIAEATGHKQ